MSSSPQVPSVARRLVGGTVAVSAATILARGGTFLGNLIAIRLLDQSAVGQLGLIDAWLTTASMFAVFGLATAVTRQIANSLGRGETRVAGQFAAVALILVCAIGLLATLGVYVVLSYLGPNSTDATLQTLGAYAALVACLLAISALRQVVVGITYGLEAYSSLLVSSALVGLLAVPGSWLLITTRGVTGAIELRVGLALIEFLVLVVLCARTSLRLGARPGFNNFQNRARQLVSLGFPVFVGDCIANPIQPLMLSLLAAQPSGLAEVGALTAANRLASLAGFLPSSLAPTVIPILSSEWGRGDRGGFVNSTLLAVRAFWFSTLPVVVFFVAASPTLIGWLFGAEYASYWPVGVALLATTLLVSLNQTADRAFVAAGRVWLSTSNNILWLILFAGLGVIMIPLLLAFGYAAAYLLSFGLYVAWQFGWLQRLWTVPIGTLRSMLIVSAILFGTAAVGAGALQPVTQLVFACIWTSLVVVVEFAFFLRTDERQSLALHVSQVVRRFAS